MKPREAASPAGQRADSRSPWYSTPSIALATTLIAALGCEARAPAGRSGETAPVSGSGSGKVSPEDLVRVGAPLPQGEFHAIAEVVRSPDAFTGRKILVEGEVRRACNKKGCWMEVAESADPSAPGCRVTFQDYAFFVPTDSPGRRARLEGQVTIKTLRKSHVDHLEAEGANFASKNPDGSALEVQIVATGVELRKG
jgi:Domain of unknown function (DUF4920)